MFDLPFQQRVFVTVLAFTLSSPAFAAESGGATIHAAAESGDLERVKQILETTPDAWKEKNEVGKQALHLAAEKGREQVVVLLLESGADVTSRGYGEWTPLHYASRAGHPGICKVLLDAGADREAVSRFKKTPAMCATNRETLAVLQDYKVLAPGVDEFVETAALGNLDEAKKLLAGSPRLINAADSSGRTAAMEAAAHNQVEILEWLVESGADINAASEADEVTALFLACDAGHLEIVKLLLEHDAEVNPPPTEESPLTATGSPLTVATQVTPFTERGIRMLEKFLGLGDQDRDEEAVLAALADEDMSGWFKDLKEPVRSRKLEIARRLLKAGASPEIEGRGSPLGHAVLAMEPEIIRLLLDAGADPNRSMMGTPPLSTLVIRNAPEELFRLMLERGADPLLIGEVRKPPLVDGHPVALKGHSAVEFAAVFGNLRAFKLMFDSLDTDELTDRQKGELLTSGAENPECLEIVLAAELDVNLVDELKQTALHVAATRGEPKVVERLLEAGADVAARDYAGFNPVHNAAERGQVENLRLLLDKDPSLIESRTDGNSTPLICACVPSSNAQTVSMLLKRGAKVDATMDGEKTTALMKAAGLGLADIVECLVEGGANVNFRSGHWTVMGAAASCGYNLRHQKPEEGFSALPLSKEQDHLRIAEYLIEAGADVNLPGASKWKDGRRAGALPIATALHSGSVPMVKLLLKHGADPNRANQNISGRTPIYSAIATGQLKMLDLLLDHGADLRVKDDVGLTPLHFAAGADEAGMVRTLLEHGAPINAREVNGATPLLYAVFRKAPAGARALLEAGADKSIADRGENTPMDVAALNGDFAMIEILKSVGRK